MPTESLLGAITTDEFNLNLLRGVGGRSKGNFTSSAGEADMGAVNGEGRRGKRYFGIQINQLFKEQQ